MAEGSTQEYFDRVNVAVRTLDPVETVDDGTQHVVSSIHDGLFRYADGEARPWLASDHTVTGTTHTLRLKPARFHDGSRLTADDVVYSFERVAAAPASAHTGLVTDRLGIVHETDDGEYVPGSLAVEAVDDRRVRIELRDRTHTVAGTLAHPALSILPAGSVDDVPGVSGERSQETFAATEPVGCGAFTFESWTDAELTVERFDEYHAGSPSLPGIRWHLGGDGDSRYEGLRDGRIDFAGIPSQYYDPSAITVESEDELGRQRGTYELETGERLQFVRVPIRSTYYVAFDATAVPRPIRRAIAHAVNQHHEMMRFKDRHVAAYTLLPHELYPGGEEAVRADAREAYPYGYDAREIETARSLVRSAGHGPDDPFEFTVSAPVMLDWLPLYEQFRDWLSEIHVDVELERADHESLAARRQRGELDAYYGGWVADTPTRADMLRPLAPAAAELASPYQPHLSWDGTDAAAAASDAWHRLRSARAPEADDERGVAARSIEQANWEDMLVLPLHHSVKQFFWHDHVDPTIPGPMSYRLVTNADTTIST